MIAMTTSMPVAMIFMSWPALLVLEAAPVPLPLAILDDRGFTRPAERLHRADRDGHHQAGRSGSGSAATDPPDVRNRLPD